MLHPFTHPIAYIVLSEAFNCPFYCISPAALHTGGRGCEAVSRLPGGVAGGVATGQDVRGADGEERERRNRVSGGVLGEYRSIREGFLFRSSCVRLVAAGWVL